MDFVLQPNDILVRKGVANMQRGAETVGGHLYLTNQRLRFESHSFNFQTGPSEIPLTEITSLKFCWSKFLNRFPIFPNSLAVMHADGSESSFVVHARKAWAQAIQTQLDAL